MLVTFRWRAVKRLVAESFLGEKSVTNIPNRLLTSQTGLQHPSTTSMWLQERGLRVLILFFSLFLSDVLQINRYGLQCEKKRTKFEFVEIIISINYI